MKFEVWSLKFEVWSFGALNILFILFFVLGYPVPGWVPNPSTGVASSAGFGYHKQCVEKKRCDLRSRKLALGCWLGSLPKLASASDSERRKIYFFNFTYIKSRGNKKIFNYKKQYQKKENILINILFISKFKYNK